MRVVAVIVTYNRVELLKQCLAALQAQTFPPSDIVVVNNHSSDGTRAFLDGLDWPKLSVHHLSQNAGGAGGFAHGLREAAGMAVDLAWIMDDDCIPNPDALELLLRAHEHLTRLGRAHSFLCSCVVDDMGHPSNHPVPSRALNPSGWPLWADASGFGYVLVDECTFVSALIPVVEIARSGLPIREMFIWGDDTEYTKRIAQRAPGVFVGWSRVRHLRASPGQLSIFKEADEGRVMLYRHLYRNRIYQYRKYFSRERYYLYLLQVAGDLMRLCARGRLRRASIVARGFWEGLTFRPEIESVAGLDEAECPLDARLPNRSGKHERHVTTGGPS